MPISGDFAAGLVSGDLSNTDGPKIWAVIIAVGTALLLYFGRYRLLETLCVGMVLFFTLITVGNVIALQTTDYAIPASEIVRGLAVSPGPSSQAYGSPHWQLSALSAWVVPT